MDNKYRIMIGEDGDDFIFASGLTYDEAIEKKNNLTLKSGAYAYIEETFYPVRRK